MNGPGNAKQQAVVEHATNNNGTFPCTANYCAAWVTGIYQAAGVEAPTGNAIDMWENYKDTGSTSRDNIPVGAVVCGSGVGEMGAEYGHVGIYLGNGRIANNIGSFQIANSIDEWVSWQTATCHGYTGWIGWVAPNGLLN